jgi:hypothetical protein
MGKGQSLEAQKIDVKKRKVTDLNLFLVQEHYFANATRVETIKAHHNLIPSIPREICLELSNNRNLVNTLTYVDLSHNRLRSLPVTFFACCMFLRDSFLFTSQ